MWLPLKMNKRKDPKGALGREQGLAVAGRLCAFCSEVLCCPLAGATGSVTWAGSLGWGMGPGQRIHGVSHTVTLLKNMKVGVGAGSWEFTVNLTSNVNFLFPRKQFNTKTKDGFTVNTKVPSLKDQGKEYDGFTITITGDKYVCFPRAGAQTGAGVRRHADAWHCCGRSDLPGFGCLLKRR